MKVVLGSFLGLLLMVSASFASNSDLKNFSPADCRWRCAQHPDGGWCLHLNKGSKGMRPTIAPFLDLMEAARRPQKYSYLGQEVTVTSRSFSMLGPKRKVEQRGLVEELIRTTLPGRTRGSILVGSSGAFELLFEEGHPTWMIDTFSPPIGENPVKFVTDGMDYQGRATTIWFDRYFCYSVEKD